MNMRIFGFPVRFELIFFLLVGFFVLQGINQDPVLSIAWGIIITVSVLVHELGHAFAYRYYGATPSISLYGLGGVTYGHNSQHLTATQRIVVSSAGSLTTMVLLGGPAWLALRQLELTGDTWTIVNAIWFVNIVWAAINLAPVYPLDGGHIVDDGLLLATGKSQRPLVNWISIFFAIAIGGYFFISMGSAFVLLLFGYMAFVNVKQLGLVGGGQPKRPAPTMAQVLQDRPAPEPVREPHPDGGSDWQPPTSPPTR